MSMYCPSCGKQIPENSAFCSYCGKPVPTLSTAPTPPAAATVPPVTAVPTPSAAAAAPPVAPAAAPTASPVVPVAPVASTPPPAAPVFTPPPVVPVAPVAPVTAAVPPVVTSGEWDYADFVYPFSAGKAAFVKAIGRSSYTPAEAGHAFWQTYQGPISAELQKWTARGWQPMDEVGPSRFELRRATGYRDRNPLYWILMILAAIPSVGISLIVALIPSAFYEPARFVVKMRAPRGTPLPV